jgi:hypothetical protein
MQNFDDHAKSRDTHIFVIPAPDFAFRGRLQPESRESEQLQFPWTPVFTGVTIICVIVMF